MLQVANCLSPSAAKNDNESSCVGDLHRHPRIDPAGEGEDILNDEYYGKSLVGVKEENGLKPAESMITQGFGTFLYT